MVKYVLSDSCEVQINNSWNEEVEENIWDADEPDDEIKLELIDRVENDIDEYASEIRAIKDDLPKKIKWKGKVANRQKHLLETISELV